VPNQPLPEPYQSIRALHREYASRIRAIDPGLPVREQERLGMPIWFETNARLKSLRKGLPRKQPCLAMTKSGKPCSRPANPDYIGQLCASHMPHLDQW
jgi:hypothetical protein